MHNLIVTVEALRLGRPATATNWLLDAPAASGSSRPMLTKDLRMAPGANAGLGARRARQSAAAQPCARSRLALKRTPGERHARVRVAAPRRRSDITHPGRQRRL
jgi:hypothetical protein